MRQLVVSKKVVNVVKVVVKNKKEYARDKTKQNCKAAPEGALADIPAADSRYSRHDGQRDTDEDITRPEHLHSLPQHLPVREERGDSGQYQRQQQGYQI